MNQGNNELKPSIGKVYEYELMIQTTHLDTFGHVNNARYLELFEEARWDIIESGGYGLEKIQQTQIGPVLLEVKLQFKRELRNREKITIRTWATSNSGKIQTLRQVMINSNGEEACVADFVLGLFDLKARKLIVPTPEWNKALGLDA